jgi:hypothetical protein
LIHYAQPAPAKKESASMDAVEKGLQSQLKNIQSKTGQSLEQMYALAHATVKSATCSSASWAWAADRLDQTGL